MSITSILLKWLRVDSPPLAEHYRCNRIKRVHLFVFVSISYTFMLNPFNSINSNYLSPRSINGYYIIRKVVL